MCQGASQSGFGSPQSFGQIQGPRMMTPYAPRGGWPQQSKEFGDIQPPRMMDVPNQGQPFAPRMRPHQFAPQQAPQPQIPQNSVANMFGPQGGQVQSFFDSIRKYAPGQQQAPQTPNPAFNPQGPDPQQKGIIIAEGEQGQGGEPKYSPAPWTPASTPNYLHAPTAAWMYGADPWKRTDPRQVWSGGANGQWGLQPGYNGYTG